MKEILQYLKTHGERLDVEIAEAVGISLAKVRIQLSELIDIIDSLMPDDAFGIGKYHLHLKSELYDVVTRSPAEFMSLLHSFGYPNVGRDSIRAFLGAVSDFIDRHSPENRNDGTMLLKQTLRQAIQMDELVFLHDNEPGELIKDFSMFFLRSVYVFRNASHTFDRETNIEKVLQSVDVRDGQRRVDYRFVDSKDKVYVQLSDVVAGLIGKHYSYVRSHSIATLKARKAGFSELQKQNLSLLRELIDRTDAVSDGFCHSIIPLDSNIKNNVFLHGHDAPASSPDWRRRVTPVP